MSTTVLPYVQEVSKPLFHCLEQQGILTSEYINFYLLHNLERCIKEQIYFKLLYVICI